MWLFLDDVRPAPSGFDTVARTYEEAIAYLRTGHVTHISLDHDLGTEKTGYDVACWIEAQAADRAIPYMTWSVHSANPPGAARIRSAMCSAEHLWSRQE